MTCPKARSPGDAQDALLEGAGQAGAAPTSSLSLVPSAPLGKFPAWIPHDVRGASEDAIVVFAQRAAVPSAFPHTPKDLAPQVPAGLCRKARLPIRPVPV